MTFYTSDERARIAAALARHDDAIAYRLRCERVAAFLSTVAIAVAVLALFLGVTQ